MDIIDTIKEQIANNPVLIYMKGAPNAPQCGFSARAVQALMACGEKFAYVDILQNPEILTLTGLRSRSCGSTVNWLVAVTLFWNCTNPVSCRK